MDQLNLGGRVRVTTPHRASFNCRIGRIVHIARPFVANDNMKAEALARMPLYAVLLDDGSQERCCGRDLETVQTATPTPA